MKLLLMLLLLIQVSRAQSDAPPPGISGPPSIVETFPHLKDLTFKEPRSDFYLGFGITPVGVLKGRMLFGIDFFQIHWIRDFWDIEILNASYGISNGQPSYLSSRHFTFRSSPKIRFFKMFSVGPILGYEFVSFPEINSRLIKAPWTTPNWEPFSSKGIIYGVGLSQTFNIWGDYILKFNESYIKQTYSTEKTEDEWDYLYEERAIRNDKSGIDADTVMSIGISLLF